MNRGLGSDNHSGIHPRLLASVERANAQHAPSYGTDEWSERAQKLFQAKFGERGRTYFVFNGTAANALCLSSMIQSFESVLCSDVSHINMDECGAPEFFSGGKLTALPSVDGKLRLEDLRNSLIRRGDQHYSQARAVSITQPTELGTLYSRAEILEISAWAHREGLWVHMDGARFCNAITALGVGFKEMTTDLGVDVLSFGGTKNGFLFGEAVVFLNPDLARNFQFRRKQSGQLPSKSRFIACQFEEYLGTDLWREISSHSLQMAELLEQRLRAIPGLQITRPRQSNAVFAVIPKPLIKKLREKMFFYVWDERTYECRLMTSWDSKPEEIREFSDLLKSLMNDHAQMR